MADHMRSELVSRYRSASRAEAHRSIAWWVNHYNTRRKHSTIGNVPPVEWELRYARRRLQAADNVSG